MNSEKAIVSVLCNSLFQVGEKNFKVDLFDMLKCIKNDWLDFKICYQAYEYFVIIPKHLYTDIIKYLELRFHFYEDPFCVEYITIERYITVGGDESWD